MKPFTKFSLPVAVLLVVLNAWPAFAQTKTEVFDSKTPIKWLGLDYTQVTFTHAQSENESEKGVTDAQFKQIYIPAWNYLFMIEGKKFNVALTMRRPTVGYALEVTDKTNRAITRDLFAKAATGAKPLTEPDISDLVKNYDFQGNTGIGMLFFIESMNKETETEGAWVTFVDMQKKTVLFTSYVTAKTGGWGFRNNWADATFKILKAVQLDYDSWAKMP